MMSFCPFINEVCKGNQCMMWSDEACLIANYLQQMQGMVEPVGPNDKSMRIPFEIDYRRQEPSIPDEIKQLSAESLAAEYIEFLETEFPDSELTPYGQYFSLFLEAKNVPSRWGLPPDIQIKVRKAEMLARDEIQKRLEEIKKQRYESEKQELPSLISRCVDWAVTHGLKKVTHADVDAFLLEGEIDILTETKRALYSMANLQLKSKR